MVRTSVVVLLVAVGLVAGAGCRAKPRFTQPLVLAGGKTVPPEVLNEGYEAYTHYCYACHGEKGDGRGPSAPGMRPPPRDFSEAGVTFKFSGVAAGELPNDDDLIALIKNGLAGTPMLPWDMSDRERHAVVQYIKTFSERWKTDAPGARIMPDQPDPWVGKEAQAIELGKKLYHLSGIEKDASGAMKGVLAGCNTCHPSYLTRQELTQLSQLVKGEPSEFREQPHRPDNKPSQFTVGGHPISFIPTDFLQQRVKNGTDPLALFRTIAGGIGGTAMPQWKGAIPDPSLWALAYYVKSVAELRDTTAGAALQAKLSAGAK
jgi:mono/diheme cytochrome c family protein